MSRRHLQPFLNDEEVVIAAPTQVWSAPDGSYGEKPIHGVYHGDWRYVRAAHLEVDGLPPEPAGTERWRGGRVVLGLARGGPEGEAVDPRLLIRWSRQVAAGQVVETVVVWNGRDAAVDTTVEFSLEVEFGELQYIKAGDPRPVECRFEQVPDGLRASDGKRSLLVVAGRGRVAREGNLVRVTADLTVPAHGREEFALRLELADTTAVATSGTARIADLPGSGDPRLDAWARQALDDCRSLLLDAGEGPFVAAGAPWFLTLFGRDSLISARFLLPVAPDVALGTLRTLAARQGRRLDPDSAEQPGKILHELRSGELRLPGEGVTLPPVYYGTVDATALWIVLLHDTWRVGVGDEQVTPLLGNLDAALAWLRDYACPGDSGFLRYFDESGHGLANQGWKDSGDAVQFRDGRMAQGSIALAEVQAQACLAAECGADLLDAFGGAPMDAAQWGVVLGLAALSLGGRGSGPPSGWSETGSASRRSPWTARTSRSTP